MHGLGSTGTRLSLHEDWVLIPFLVTGLAGFVVSAIDFMFLQGSSFVFDAHFLMGVLFLVAGSVLRSISRRDLVKAGMRLRDTPFLQVDEHKLVTSGAYGVVRHPLYLGEILRNLGVPLLFKSLYGGLFILVGIILLCVRIEIEEKMLITRFGQEYITYRNKTKKLIPLIY